MNLKIERPNGQKIEILVSALREMADDAEKAASPQDIRKIIWGLRAAVKLASLCLFNWHLKRYQTVKKAAMFLILFLTMPAGANNGGISCSTDADCTAWSYGETMSCGTSSYCNAGTFYSCTSGTYYCALNCTGVCNNWSKTCDGSCIPQPGGCDPGTCGSPVCTPQGPCSGTCGDGVCDTGEDATNCPADCGGSPGTTAPGSTTTTLLGSPTTTLPAATTTTAPPTTTTMMSAPNPGAIDLQISGYIYSN